MWWDCKILQPWLSVLILSLRCMGRYLTYCKISSNWMIMRSFSWWGSSLWIVSSRTKMMQSRLILHCSMRMWYDLEVISSISIIIIRGILFRKGRTTWGINLSLMQNYRNYKLEIIVFYSILYIKWQNQTQQRH